MARKKGDELRAEKVKMGKRYRDEITGWEGTATAIFFYMNGCVRVNLEGRDPSGKPDEMIFDEQRLVDVEEDRKPEGRATAGGPRTTPPVTGQR